MKGLERIWFISENFGFRSFDQYFKSRNPADYSGYCMEHYEVSNFMTNKFACLDPSFLSRFRNLLVEGINAQITLPKMIVVVPDADILNAINNGRYREGISKEIRQALNWIMREFYKIVSAHKDVLPTKAKKTNYPQLRLDPSPLT